MVRRLRGPRARVLMAGVTAALISTLAAASGPGGAVASSFVNWPSYGRDSAHDSNQAAATAITVANAGHLKALWHWSAVPKPPTDTLLYSSAITVGGVIYIGADTGDF